MTWREKAKKKVALEAVKHVKDNFIVGLGSGSTAVACKQLNRNFIGFEINKKYVKIANERLKRVEDSPHGR